MPERDEEQQDQLRRRVRATEAGLIPLLAEAQATWNARGAEKGADGAATPGWRSFEDAFPTFYQFTNRPR
jgi:hypothetical protein